MAMQFAAGLHPFRARTEVEPVRVLVIDLENSLMQVQRSIGRMYANVGPLPGQLTLAGETAPGFDPTNLRIEVQPLGIDLLQRPDRRWFSEVVDANRPDILMTGPVYKLFRGKPGDEEAAAAVAGYLDDIRGHYDCALILEAHSPHGTGVERTLRQLPGRRRLGAVAWAARRGAALAHAPDLRRALAVGQRCRSARHHPPRATRRRTGCRGSVLGAHGHSRL
jgi:RecA-family ATPase